MKRETDHIFTPTYTEHSTQLSKLSSRSKNRLQTSELKSLIKLGIKTCFYTLLVIAALLFVLHVYLEVHA